ncbi:MAG TPA: basic secretory protein-like protein [Candidatus Paceibacterota bacterium]|nr:basic secretory protein-like protein [Candidatus Paceibacterota bacterium]
MSNLALKSLGFGTMIFCLVMRGVSGADVARETNSPSGGVWVGTGLLPDHRTEFRIEVRSGEARGMDEWARRSGELCRDWYPKIAALLDSKGFVPPTNVTVVFRDGMGGVASTSANRIEVAASYVRQATNDFGMVIHELVHVVQSYPRGNPGWLVEGIADYVRLSCFEPDAKRPSIDPDRSSYQDSYKTTAAFFDWAQKNFDPQLVQELNRAAREGSFKPELFKQRTGKTVDELWKAFTDTLRAKATL